MGAGGCDRGVGGGWGGDGSGVGGAEASAAATVAAAAAWVALVAARLVEELGPLLATPSVDPAVAAAAAAGAAHEEAGCLLCGAAAFAAFGFMRIGGEALSPPAERDGGSPGGVPTSGEGVLPYGALVADARRMAAFVGRDEGRIAAAVVALAGMLRGGE